MNNVDTKINDTKVCKVFLQSIGEFIGRKLKKSGKTYETIAKESIMYKKSMISKIINGKTDFKVSYLALLNKYYDISFEEFFAEQRNEEIDFNEIINCVRDMKEYEDRRYNKPVKLDNRFVRIEKGMSFYRKKQKEEGLTDEEVEVFNYLLEEMKKKKIMFTKKNIDDYVKVKFDKIGLEIQYNQEQFEEYISKFISEGKYKRIAETISFIELWLCNHKKDATYRNLVKELLDIIVNYEVNSDEEKVNATMAYYYIVNVWNQSPTDN